MHLTNLLNTLGIKGYSFPTSHVSKTSISYEIYITYFVEFAKGQYFNNPSSKNNPRDGSFARNSIEHLIKCSWNRWQVWTLWRGIIAFLKKITCYSLRGTAKPEIMAARMSRSSEVPLNL